MTDPIEMANSKQIARAIAEIDGLTAFATAAKHNGYCAPEFCNEAVIEIDAGRHPVVEAQVRQANENFIANEMPESIVVLFEVINIEHDQAERLVLRQACFSLLA